ncbi:MAG TPA: hypothetical protein VK196_14935 [Magnetospirillum sp.]|nr:hypothetical protein [Magnetospirillum sp.]
MLDTCPYCHDPVPSHGICCRVPDDLDRFERVFQRLLAHHDNQFLQENLLRYLVAYGRRPQEDLPPHCYPLRGGVNSATSGAW